MVENSSYITSIFVTIKFAFRLGKSPLAAKREEEINFQEHTISFREVSKPKG